MIKSKTYVLHLAYQEIAALYDFIYNKNKSVNSVLNGASFNSDMNGVSISCISEKQADEIWDMVIEATDESEED